MTHYGSLYPADCFTHRSKNNQRLYRVRFRPPNDREYIQLRCAECVMTIGYHAQWPLKVVEVLS